ncbi:MAG: hypothetical protein NT138_18710 [Planctomycetales bacterium]|nr:hypothetical protein [Planctomycetales bacterium]
MALPAFVTKLVSDLRTERKNEHRTARGANVDLHRRLGSGAEVDANEVKRILFAAGKSDDDFEREAQKQQQRFAWHAQRVQNQQAVSDRLQAESELHAAQRALQAAYDKLQPAIDQAHDRLNAANHRFMTTTQAEAWLSDPENILDKELLEREAAVVARLREVNNELKPLLQDQARRQTTLENLQSHVGKLREHTSIPWLPLEMLGLQQADEAIKSTDAHVAAVRNELQQLQEAIRQRQQKQVRLQAELNQIHAEKLKP